MFRWKTVFGGLAWVSGAILLPHPQELAAECVPNTLTIELDSCLEVGSEVVASIALSNASEPIFGGQFFLEYNTSVFQVTSVAPGDWPFVLKLYLHLEPGLIDQAVGVYPGGDGTMDDTVMAYITFLVIDDQGGMPFIRFRPHDPPTRLIGEAGLAITPHLVDAGEVEDIDLTDIAAFQNCFGGTGVEVQPECTCRFDVDGDSDVDLGDYQAFQAMLDGPTSWFCEYP